MSDVLFGLPLQAVEKLRTVFAHWPLIATVWIYGSRAKGCHRQGSDIDLTLEAPGMSLADLLKLENEIDDLLLPWMVDLSLRDRIDNADLLDHISRVGQVFYRRAEA